METRKSTAPSVAQARLARAQGVLMALSDPPPGEDAAFNTWYDGHAPDRLGVPGVFNARRYQAATDDGPRYMAYYDLESPDTLETPEYRALRENPPQADRVMMPRLPLLERRVLRLIIDGDEWTADAPYILAVALQPPDGAEDDLVAWYRAEHIRMLLDVPGWNRARLFEQVEGSGPRFAALHELESPAVFETDQYQRAVSTPWRNRLIGSVTRRERYLFKFLRGFDRSPSS